MFYRLALLILAARASLLLRCSWQNKQPCLDCITSLYAERVCLLADFRVCVGMMCPCSHLTFNETKKGAILVDSKLSIAEIIEADIKACDVSVVLCVLGSPHAAM